MKLTGPEGWPPVESFSFDDRKLEKLVPVPEPYLKSMPSVLASVRMESMVSSTALMKQAEHCGFASTPTLNHTGELKLTSWVSRMWVSSSSKMRASLGLAK